MLVSEYSVSFKSQWLHLLDVLISVKRQDCWLLDFLISRLFVSVVLDLRSQWLHLLDALIFYRTAAGQEGSVERWRTAAIRGRAADGHVGARRGAGLGEPVRGDVAGGPAGACRSREAAAAGGGGGGRRRRRVGAAARVPRPAPGQGVRGGGRRPDAQGPRCVAGARRRLESNRLPRLRRPRLNRISIGAVEN